MVQDEIAELDAFAERLEVHMKKDNGKKGGSAGASQAPAPAPSA